MPYLVALATMAVA